MKFEGVWIVAVGVSLFLTLGALLFAAVEIGQASYIPWLWSYGLMHGEGGDRARFLASISAVVAAVLFRGSRPLVRLGLVTLCCVLLASSTWLLVEVIWAGKIGGWYDAISYAFRHANERVIAYLTPMVASLMALLVVATAIASASSPPGRTI